MKIELQKIKIKDIVEGYKDTNEDGVVGYGGILNIRPKYQREFVYKDKQRDSVIESIRGGFPLNVMYWVRNDDNTFEVLDGQQRTISFCQYVKGNFSINYQYFHNLEKDEQQQILDYEVMVYFCEGTDKEKLDWFKTINIAGVQLADQELRNAIYTGEWLTDAKGYFSKTQCPVQKIAGEYLNGSSIRQDYLETAIKWISNNNIEQYMADHQHKSNANELWLYFQNVISWVKVLFPNFRKEMKGIDWGYLYNQYKNEEFDSDDLEEKVKRLMMDDDVTNKKGIYPYLITDEEKWLNIRAFTPNQKREVYEKQNGVCKKCGQAFEIEKMEGDHITPWSEGGKTNIENCQMLCKNCNRSKSDK
jgi:hypothetical protein